MQVAVVTGAASGIGQAVAIEYAKRDIAVVAGYFPGDLHDPSETGRVVKLAGGLSVMHPVDVRDLDQFERLSSKAPSEFGHLDFTVANAGYPWHLLSLSRPARSGEMNDVDLSGVPRFCWAVAMELALCGISCNTVILGPRRRRLMTRSTLSWSRGCANPEKASPKSEQAGKKTSRQ
ncbi:MULTISPECIES: SDR family NAD(P)-dependent oxidoreductase [unclassified Burkholderia]|uniref:SDR family NAD(P)-dependent oxidoreductase n=1 Tax=unclassified Burkholderia TaxID=2613784 RepID=UPI0021AB7680|nr:MULTISPECIES: SDR family NAD(P)-dependent oxidoreductase [unclassified Burkholderia]